MDHEQVFDHRTIATRGIVVAVNDTGCVQTVDVQTHDGVVRSGIEVHHPFGAASCPPQNGAVVVLIANGADPSDMIALPSAVPLGRLGGLLPGEYAIYGSDGSRVHIRQGGIVEILAATHVVVTAPNVQITCTGTLSITGSVSITGDLAISGKLSTGSEATLGGSLNVTGNIDATGSINPET